MKYITANLTKEIRTAHYEKTGSAWLAVGSGSMEPLIKPGDQVVMSAIAPEDIRCGEIIVFRRNGNLIGHRVLKKQDTRDGARFIEKGDSSDIVGSFTEIDVIGRVIAIQYRNRIIYLDTISGRIINTIHFGWFSFTTFVHTRLNGSRYKSITIVDSVFKRIFRLATKFLVSVSCVVLYLMGHSKKMKFEETKPRSGEYSGVE